MPQPQLEKIVYPAVRDLMLAQPTAGDSISHNGWSVDSDSRAWMAQGRGFTLHPSDRSYQPTRKSASATDFYNTDQAAKMSVAHRVHRSPYRYVAMRSQSAGRDAAHGGAGPSTGERVGPGSYSPSTLRMPRFSPNNAVFASGVPRAGLGVLQQKQPIEPGYASLSHDRRLWHTHHRRLPLSCQPSAGLTT